MAKLLVRTGTLRTGDVVVCGSAYGRVKAMYDTLDLEKKYGAELTEAGPDGARRPKDGVMEGVMVQCSAVPSRLSR